MFSPIASIPRHTPGFEMNKMRFTKFTPRLYNLCTNRLKMQHDLIMPARSFCSDGSQGAPTMLMAKHFGTFPFDFGALGGILDFNRNGAFVTHGNNLVIVQATHVGFNTESKTYGTYPRHRTALKTGDFHHTANCGHVSAVISAYQKGYSSASTHTLVMKADPKVGSNNNNKNKKEKTKYLLTVRDFFFEKNPRFRVHINLNFDKMIDSRECVGSSPVSRTFRVSKEFEQHLDKYEKFRNLKPFSDAEQISNPESSSSNYFDVPTSQEHKSVERLGDALTEEYFKFDRCTVDVGDDLSELDKDIPPYETNIENIMNWVVTHPEPMLAAAQGCIQAEFHRVLNEFYYSKDTFSGRRLIYVAGITIDVAPKSDQILEAGGAFFPRTYFAPWAAYVQFVDEDTGVQRNEIWEQDRILEELRAQPSTNDRQMKLDDEITKLKGLPPIEFN